MQAAYSRGAVGASDRGVGALRAAWVGCVGAFVFGDEVVFCADSASRPGLEFVLMVAYGLALEVWCVSSVWPGLFPSASGLKSVRVEAPVLLTCRGREMLIVPCPTGVRVSGAI